MLELFGDLLGVHELPFFGVDELRAVDRGCRRSGRRTLSEADLLQIAGPSAGGLTDKVVALGYVRRAPGGLDVRRGGSGQVAVELVQIAPDGMPPVAVAEHLAQPIGLEQPRGATEDMTDRDRA